MNERDKNLRYLAIRECGCIACRMFGVPGIVPPQIHHLNFGDKHGGKRLGDEYTVGLCPWHHMGQPDQGMWKDEAQTYSGPSWAFLSQGTLMGQCNSLERAAKRAIRETSQTRMPSRQYKRPPSPIGTADPFLDMLPLATLVAARIRSNRYGENCGSFVLGDDAGRVFVLKEQGVTTASLVAANARWLVGLYAGSPQNKKRARCPGAEQLFEDLKQHFIDLGMVASQVFRGRDAEA